MNAPIDLQKIERRAWTSYYQDGLWDIYLGLLLLILGLMSSFLIEVENIWLRALISFVLIGGAWLLFQAGRRWITLPRLGRAEFGPERLRRKARLGFVLIAFGLLNLLLLIVALAANQNPATWGRLIPEGFALKFFMGVFIGSAMAFIAYFNDFKRGYYIALVLALTFAGTEILDGSWAFWAGGVLIFIPGMVLFFRFLKKYPQTPGEVIHDRT